MKIIILFLCFPFLACSQSQEKDWVKQHQEDYKNVVKNFYTIIYSNQASSQKISDVYWDASLDSGMFYKIEPYLKELTDGLSVEEIFKIIDKAEAYDDGLQFGIYIELPLSEKNKIYFGLGSDIPTIIEYIWLSDGTLLGSKVRNESPVQKLILVGTINDKDGYSNVRKNPDKNAQIITKFTKNEIFYFTPTKSDWWPVYKEEGGKQIGFINKTRILRYIDFPPKLKEKVKKLRGGC